MEAPNISMCEFRRLWNICAKSGILLQRLIALDLFLSKLDRENGGVSAAARFRLGTDNQRCNQIFIIRGISNYK